MEVLLHQRLAKGVKVCLVEKKEKDILDLTELSELRGRKWDVQGVIMR